MFNLDSIYTRFQIILLFVLSSVFTTQAITNNDDAESGSDKESFETLIAEKQRYEGVLDLYLDTESGEMPIAINEEALNDT